MRVFHAPLPGTFCPANCPNTPTLLHRAFAAAHAAHMRSLLRDTLFVLFRGVSFAATQSKAFSDKAEVVDALAMLLNHLHQCQTEHGVMWLRFFAELLAPEVSWRYSGWIKPIFSVVEVSGLVSVVVRQGVSGHAKCEAWMNFFTTGFLVNKSMQRPYMPIPYFGNVLLLECFMDSG